MRKKNEKTKNKKMLRRMRTDGFSFAALVHNLKKLFLPWLILAVLTAGIIIGSNVIFSTEVDAVSSTIAFYYNGIEDGLDPNGCEFDKNSIKDDAVISEALAEMNLPEDMLETVQNGIYIDSCVSTSAINNIASYQSIYDSDSTNWIKTMKDSSYHPTAYNVSFNYSNTSLSGNEAADLLNIILEKYQTYFLETYGYNESVGESVLAVDFDSYDYLIALDMYNSKLTSLENYLNTLAKNDKSQFRSEKTGYSFSDLSNSIALIRSVDVDTLTSYILNNGVISDKSMILSYYNFRLDSLKRHKQSAKECLDSTIDSIESYQKDSIIIFDGSSENTSITETSEVYDELIQEKIQLQDSVAYYDAIISDLNERVTTINKTSASTSKTKKAYVEEQINALNEKLTVLINDIKITADDYYETEKFLNAVSVISPAQHSVTKYIKSAVDQSIRMLVIDELALMTLYLFISIAICLEYKVTKLRRKAAEK